jgi:hypothetical protein
VFSSVQTPSHGEARPVAADRQTGWSQEANFYCHGGWQAIYELIAGK